MGLREDVERWARRAAAIIRDELGTEVAVIWFGSWVTGRALPRSDIDLAVAAPGPISPRARARIDERIESLPTLRGIDVVDLHIAGPRLRGRIHAEGIPL